MLGWCCFVLLHGERFAEDDLWMSGVRKWKGTIEVRNFATMFGLSEKEVHKLCDDGILVSSFVRVIHGTWVEDERGNRTFEPT